MAGEANGPSVYDVYETGEGEPRPFNGVCCIYPWILVAMQGSNADLRGVTGRRGRVRYRGAEVRGDA